MPETSQQLDSQQGATPLTRCAVALVIMASFALISSDWRMSRQFEAQKGLAFYKQEKQAEQRQADTSSASAAGFFLFAIGGIIAAARKPLRPTAWTHPALIACLAFAGWCALSMLWSPSPELSLRKVAILMLFLTGTLGLARVLTLGDLAWVVALCGASFLAIGLAAEISLGTFRPGQAGYRFCGTFHPNDQGLQCALLVLASIALLRQATRHVWLASCLLAAGSIGLVLTKSRTALAALLCALLFGLLLHSRGKQRILLASSLTVLVCLGVMAYSFLPAGAVKSTQSLVGLGRTGYIDSLTGRIPLWQELLKEVETHPWLGTSYGGFWDVERIHRYSEMFEWQIPNAHNTYLDLVLSVGIVGLCLYLCWILAAWLVAVIKHERSAEAADLFACCLVAFSIVHGFAESKFPFPGMSSAFLFLAVFVLTAKPISIATSAPSRESTTRRPPVGWRLLPDSPRGIST